MPDHEKPSIDLEAFVIPDDQEPAARERPLAEIGRRLGEILEAVEAFGGEAVTPESPEAS